MKFDRSGRATWVVNSYIVTSCDVVVTYFPFDIQVCSVCVCVCLVRGEGSFVL